jgi:hypothetical protein
MRSLIAVVAVGLILTVAAMAGATSVTYTVQTWGPQAFPADTAPAPGAPWGPNGYPGDTVTLQTYTGNIDLTPGTYTQKINSLLWSVNYTYGGTATDYNAWSELLFNFTAARAMTIGTATDDLSQTGLLDVNWYNDDLSFFDGSTTTFYVEGYRVDVTPLGLEPTTNVFPPGDNPWAQLPRDVMARFDVSVSEAPVPEPVTMAGLMLGIGGLVGYVRRRVRK